MPQAAAAPRHSAQRHRRLAEGAAGALLPRAGGGGGGGGGFQREGAGHSGSAKATDNTAAPGEDEAVGTGRGGLRASLFERQSKAPICLLAQDFLLKERNPKAPTLLPLPKLPHHLQAGRFATWSSILGGTGGGGRRTEVDFLVGHGTGAKLGALPHLLGGCIPLAFGCCPRSKPGVGRAAVEGGRRGGRQRGEAFNRVQGGWCGRAGRRRKGSTEIGLNGEAAVGPKNSAGPCLGGGGPGKQRADGGSNVLTGLKSQTSEGQPCPALDSPPAGSRRPQHAANWEHHSEPRWGGPGRRRVWGSVGRAAARSFPRHRGGRGAPGRLGT